MENNVTQESYHCELINIWQCSLQIPVYNKRVPKCFRQSLSPLDRKKFSVFRCRGIITGTPSPFVLNWSKNPMRILMENLARGYKNINFTLLSSKGHNTQIVHYYMQLRRSTVEGSQVVQVVLICHSYNIKSSLYYSRNIHWSHLKGANKITLKKLFANI